MAKADDNINLIRARVASSRNDFFANVEGLVSEVHPTAVKNRAINDTKVFVSETVDDAKAQVIDESGPRWDRIGTAVLAVVGVVAFVVSVRGIGHAVSNRRHG